MDTDGYATSEASAAYVVTHTSGTEVISDGYASWEDASSRAEEVYRNGDFPVTIDSTSDRQRWSYGTDGELEPVSSG